MILMRWYDMIWHGMTWYDMTCYGMTWYHILYYDSDMANYVQHNKTMWNLRVVGTEARIDAVIPNLHLELYSMKGFPGRKKPMLNFKTVLYINHYKSISLKHTTILTIQCWWQLIYVPCLGGECCSFCCLILHDMCIFSVTSPIFKFRHKNINGIDM